MKKIQIHRLDYNTTAVRMADYEKGGWENWRTKYTLPYKKGVIINRLNGGELPIIEGVKFIIRGDELDKKFAEFIVAEGKVISKPKWLTYQWIPTEEGEIELIEKEERKLGWLVNEEDGLAKLAWLAKLEEEEKNEKK